MSKSVSSYAHATREEIQREIDSLTRALDNLKATAANESRDQFDGLRSRVERLWHNVNFEDSYADLSRKTRRAGRMAKDSAREHPVSTAVLGLGVAAVVGWLIARR